MPVYTAELYPTAIRNAGVGACNVAAGVALIIVPYLSLLVSKNTHFPEKIRITDVSISLSFIFINHLNTEQNSAIFFDAIGVIVQYYRKFCRHIFARTNAI